MRPPLWEWELDDVVEHTAPVQGVRLGTEERDLLRRLAAELGLTPARLARRLLVKGLLDLEEGRL